MDKLEELYKSVEKPVVREVYFIRHSIRDTSIQDDLNAPLTQKGVQLAESLVQLLPLEKIETIYSSPCLRAIQTVMPISLNLKTKIIVSEELREREINEWLVDFDKFTLNQWQDTNYKTKKGESLKEVKKRIVPYFDSLMKSTTEGLLVSSHGTLLAVLFFYLTNGTFDYSMFKSMTQPDIYIGSFDDEFKLIKLQRKLLI